MIWPTVVNYLNYLYYTLSSGIFKCAKFQLDWICESVKFSLQGLTRKYMHAYELTSETMKNLVIK